MKKTLIILVLLALIILPVLTAAAISLNSPPPIQCCKLKHTISVGEGDNVSDFKSNWLVGPVTADTANCPMSSIDDVHITPFWAGLCALSGVITVSEIILYIGLLAVGVALVFAGIMYITAAGSPERVKTANEIFKWSLIGVLIAVLSRFIPSLARYFIGI